jgi:hypothetical protein
LYENWNGSMGMETKKCSGIACWKGSHCVEWKKKCRSVYVAKTSQWECDGEISITMLINTFKHIEIHHKYTINTFKYTMHTFKTTIKYVINTFKYTMNTFKYTMNTFKCIQIYSKYSNTFKHTQMLSNTLKYIEIHWKIL